jgi:hypothetical protein
MSFINSSLFIGNKIGQGMGKPLNKSGIKLKLNTITKKRE